MMLADFDLAVARNNIELFLDNQRSDGAFPCLIRPDQLSFAYLASGTSMAELALELAERISDETLLRRSYRACGDWDIWVEGTRNTLGVGLVETFCAADCLGPGRHRFSELPPECLQDDASRCSPAAGLPWLSPDLTAALFSGRIALAKMARLLQLEDEAVGWTSRAEALRERLVAILYDDSARLFHDLRADGTRGVACKSSLLTVAEHRLLESPMFDEIWFDHLAHPQRFFTPLPFPSVAVDEPAYVADLTEANWSGPSQALTALRSIRWLEHYGKFAAQHVVFSRWLEVLCRSSRFEEQFDPHTGVGGGAASSTAAMLCVLQFVQQLFGVRVRVVEGLIDWNFMLPAHSTFARFECDTPVGRARVESSRDGTLLTINEQEVGMVNGVGRLVTDLNADPVEFIGTAPSPTSIRLHLGDYQRLLLVQPDERVKL